MLKINFVVNNPVERKGHKVIVRYAGTENYIKKDDVSGQITQEQVKLWRLIGLSDGDIQAVVRFLRT